jgi:hypothetical protein
LTGRSSQRSSQLIDGQGRACHEQRGGALRHGGSMVDGTKKKILKKIKIYSQKRLDFCRNLCPGKNGNNWKLDGTVRMIIKKESDYSLSLIL